jgi:hypothetical protein
MGSIPVPSIEDSNRLIVVDWQVTKESNKATLVINLESHVSSVLP